MTPTKRTKSYMSRSEFKVVLEFLFPQERGRITYTARMLHRDIRTVRRWKNGALPIPPEAAMLLRAAIKYQLKPFDIESLARKEGISI